MKPIKKPRTATIAFIILVFLITGIYWAQMIINHKKTFNYLALGDSIAAGVSPFSTKSNIKYELSYPDFIAEILKEREILKGYSKKFAVPGSTSIDLLNDIKHDVLKQGESIRERISEANLITIGIGANDLFKEYKKVKPNVNFTLNSIQLNLSQVISEINKINPSSKIYIIGYYNLLPFDISSNSEQFKDDFGELNGLLEKISKKYHVEFVEIEILFKDNYSNYLPVVGDVHPNELGHKLIASKALEYIIYK
jgi:lysophospholipase L1-like esterase